MSTGLSDSSVLIADPSPDVRPVLVELCRAQGVEPIEAHSFMDAVNALVAHRPALAVIAEDLPDLGGVSLAAAIRTSKDYANTPIVLTAPHRAEVDAMETADVVLSTRGKDLLHGFTDFMSLLGLLRESETAPETSLAGTILVADDDRVTQQLHARHLCSAGAEVEVADDGRAAVRAVSKRTFDLLLFDIEMPKVDGWQAIDRIRRHGIETPAIAVTGHRDVSMMRRTIAAGFDTVIAKPVRRPALIERCARFIRA